MLKFPAHFERDDQGCYFVFFRDIPEALTQGHTLEEARQSAQDALITAMDFYFEDHRRVPVASTATEDEEYIELPISIGAKILLLNEMIDRQLRPSDLAKSMNIKPQEVTRIMNLHHTTKIDTLASAFSAIGCRLDFMIS